MTRAILHCDLDAFYASVEQRDHPEYRGKPVIVGGTGPAERGVVMAASYEARAFGVHSAMPLAIAGRLCPDGIYVPGNFDRYVEASDAVMAIFEERTPLVEPISLDEAFLDVTATEHLFGGAVSMAKEIKRAVREHCGLVVSVGVATNKLCAKIGSDPRSNPITFRKRTGRSTGACKRRDISASVSPGFVASNSLTTLGS